ncbi:MAG TPA: PEP-CTERM sorting domain-containing protein [Paludibaculum sp.]|jgi:hypothetical protein
MSITSAASGAVLFTITDSLANTDPTQLGRLSRNGIPQDWAGSEPFPGTINLATPYHYRYYDVNVGATPFIQIIMDASTVTEFASAYITSYDPANKATNWLGDAGVSGNYFGVDPLFFQVIATPNSILRVVINNTTGGALPLGNGIFTLTVEGYIDSSFGEPGAVPEPATLGLTLAGLGALAFLHHRRRRNASSITD